MLKLKPVAQISFFWIIRKLSLFIFIYFSFNGSQSTKQKQLTGSRWAVFFLVCAQKTSLVCLFFGLILYVTGRTDYRRCASAAFSIVSFMCMCENHAWMSASSHPSFKLACDRNERTPGQSQRSEVFKGLGRGWRGKTASSGLDQANLVCCWK